MGGGVLLCRRRSGAECNRLEEATDRRDTCRPHAWTVSNSPATLVMPTGTGKTETMLSILVSMKCRKLLVIVPTDALRTQPAKKFLSLGVLKAPGSPILTDIA